ncbi:MAG: UDP-3-O-(3-hydroxymyristoyl)glucosamine N-acyltransferase [Candidatus Omnitrophica bacterium]|nr:UDP-3-O-(3-hydroxymyristoyl)glucosamine N-acyltransferase [Candidatus Omnitrophota bacterium]
MKKSVKEIAELLGAKVIGDPNVVITGVAGIEEAKEGDVVFVGNPKYLHRINESRAAAVIASQEIKGFSKPIIKTENPSLAFSKVVSLFFPPKKIMFKGIHSTVILGKDVELGQDVSIGPYVVIEDGVKICDRSIIYSGVCIGYESKIGKDCVIYPNVSLREKTIVGDRVIIHNGTVIGSDGFGYDTKDGKHHKIPQVGFVVIEDDVEIGANVTIDRARLDKTLIGKGTKIDNLVHIAHNVTTGENCIIVAQVGISGSTKIGKNVTLAGQAGIAGHIAIGDNVIVGAQAGVTKSIPANTFVSGYPAKPHKEATKINAYIQRLPQLNETVAELKARLDKIDKDKKRPHGKSKDNKKRSRS